MELALKQNQTKPTNRQLTDYKIEISILYIFYYTTVSLEEYLLEQFLHW